MTNETPQLLDREKAVRAFDKVCAVFHDEGLNLIEAYEVVCAAAGGICRTEIALLAGLRSKVEKYIIKGIDDKEVMQ